MTKIDLVVTDPPYNVAYEGKAGTIQNDDMGKDEFRKFLTSAFSNMESQMKPGASFYVWYATKESVIFETSLAEAGLKIKQQLVWNKNTFVLGRQDYQWKHEPCLYGWKEGAAHYFRETRLETTVLEDRPNISRMSKPELITYVKDLWRKGPPTTVIDEDKPVKSDLHPTMKPIKLIGYLIGNSSRRGETVLDPFGGSGTTLMACEQLGRKCRTMELDEKYASAIVKRWEEYTGRKAELIKEN